MANIPIRDIPGGVVATPQPTDRIAIDNGTSMQQTTLINAVNGSIPVVSQASAEAGTDNSDRMTSLRTKQSIASQVGVTIASKAQGDKADSAVQPSRQIIAGAGLTGGGDLSSDKTINVGAGLGITVNADDVSLSSTTISRLLPAAGTTSQVLQKASNSDYDVSWATVAAATAVSYAPQTLSSGEQLQARTNISAADSATAVTLTGTQTLTNKTLTLPQGEFLRGMINGLVLSNNTTDAVNDIDISAGAAASDGGTPALMVLASSLTKRLDATWAVGSGNGGLDTGTIANLTYHVWLIQRSDTGVVDALFSASATSPTMPTNYDRKRRIGSIVRKSAAIKAFSQNGDEFLWLTSELDVNGVAVGVSAQNLTLTVPSGIKTTSILNFSVLSNSASVAVLFTSPDQTNVAAGLGNCQLFSQVANVGNVGCDEIRTNTSSQIRVVSNATSQTCAVTVFTKGYIDTRGRT